MLGSVLAGRLILPGHGFTPAHGYPPVPGTTAPTCGPPPARSLYLALIALLSLGVAAAVRDSAVGHRPRARPAVPVPDHAAVVSDATLARHLEQIAPMTAGLDVQATTGLNSLPLTPWQGLGVARPLGRRRPAPRRTCLEIPRRMTPYTNLTCDSPSRQGTTETRAPQNRLIGFTHLGPSGWVTTSAYSARSAPHWRLPSCHRPRMRCARLNAWREPCQIAGSSRTLSV